MLRFRTDEGWFLLTHPEHARIAGVFAAAWGNERFRVPFPRADVVEAVRRHDDGWAVRDRTPSVTREGRPSAFGDHLVGKYSAFEEIDLVEYLGVRGRAMEVVAAENPYAAVLVSMHTCNLLTEHADRSTIRPDNLPRLDDFVACQRERQSELLALCAASGRHADRDLSGRTLLENFRLLQACDNMSLLSCVDFAGPAGLLHPLPCNDGTTSEVAVRRIGPRAFRLDPWPFAPDDLRVEATGRHVAGEIFPDDARLQAAYAAAAESRVAIELVR
jgi:hypothetical protein